MQILVTGHEGFIGRNMLGWLQQEDGWHVDGWEYQSGEFPDVRSYDWVIHLGAITDPKCKDVDGIMAQNFEFSQRLYNECNETGVHLQYASSSTVYGDTKDFSEYAACQPQTPYAWSKYLFDRWVFQQHPVVMVQGFRYFDVYGRYMHLPKSPCVIHKWREQSKLGYIEVPEDSEHIRRDFVWVGDVCKLHIDFLKTVKGSGIWNVGSGLTHSLLDIAEEIAEQENVRIELVETEHVPLKSCADLAHLKETVGKRKWLNVFEFLNQ
jgi:ADP-L-glycero-D-manno-heptose 6-epimerase